MFTKKKSVWLFLAPGLIFLLLFYVLPFGGGIYYSLTDGTYQNSFVGFDNYKTLLGSEIFLLGLKNTLALSALCAPLVWVLSLLLAALLRALRGAGQLFRNAMLLPYLMPSSALLLIWLVLFDYGGYVNRLLSLLGAPRMLWLEGAMLRAPVVLLYVWRNLGFSIVLFTAALQAVPEDYYEYAALEGAGFWRRTFQITLPLIAPTAYLVFIMAWINAFKVFKEAYFIGGAYPDPAVYTLQHYMNNMFGKLNYQNVTTAAYSFALIVFALFALLYLPQAREGRRSR